MRIITARKVIPDRLGDPQRWVEFFQRWLRIVMEDSDPTRKFAPGAGLSLRLFHRDALLREDDPGDSWIETSCRWTADDGAIDPGKQDFDRIGSLAASHLHLDAPLLAGGSDAGLDQITSREANSSRHDFLAR